MLTRLDIINYYNYCEWQYRKGWLLNENMSFHSGYWDETTKSLSDAIKHENDVLARLVNISSTDILLDAGCGVGGSSVYLAKKYNCKVTGISIVPKQVLTATQYAAKENVADKVAFLEADFLNTPFKNGSFDIVWAIESVCYAEKKQKFFEEAYRLLKKGGRLIIADLFLANDMLELSDLDWFYKKTLNRVAVNDIATESNFNKYAIQTGFQKYTFQDVTDKTLHSFRIMYWGSVKYALLGWVLFKLDHITRVEYENLLVGINLKRARNKGLWKYGIFYAQK